MALNASALMISGNADAATLARLLNADRYRAFLTEASQRFRVPTAWLAAVLQVESGGNAHAVSPKGAMGLMQLMPETWAAFRARYHLGSDPFDPHDNVIAGAAYLRELLDRFGTLGFLAAYNAGPRRFEDYVAGLRPLRAETTAYLSKLARLLPDLPLPRFSTDVHPTSDWQTVTLFAGSSITQPTSSPAAQTSPQDRNASRANFSLAPQSNGLFVPVAITQP